MHQALRGFEFGERKHRDPQETLPPEHAHHGPSPRNVIRNDGPIGQALLCRSRVVRP